MRMNSYSIIANSNAFHLHSSFELVLVAQTQEINIDGKLKSSHANLYDTHACVPFCQFSANVYKNSLDFIYLF